MAWGGDDQYYKDLKAKRIGRVVLDCLEENDLISEPYTEEKIRALFSQKLVKQRSDGHAR